MASCGAAEEEGDPAAHNLLSPAELLARGFEEGEELLLPYCGDSSDEDEAVSAAPPVGVPASASEADAVKVDTHGVGWVTVDETSDVVADALATATSPPVSAGLVVREIAEGPLGAQVFPCSRVLLHWLRGAVSSGPIFRDEDGGAPPLPALEGSRVLELGTGTGSLAMGLVTSPERGGLGAARVFATEGDSEVLANLRFNIRANGLEGSVEALQWDWEETQDPPAEVDVGSLDLVVAADVVYVGTAEVQLATALSRLCGQRGRSGAALQALVLLADRPPGGQEFLPAAQSRDPLADDDEEEEASDSSAVERFLAACRRRALEVGRLELPAELIEEALRGGGMSGAGGRPDGELCLYRLRAAGRQQPS